LRNRASLRGHRRVLRLLARSGRGHRTEGDGEGAGVRSERQEFVKIPLGNQNKTPVSLNTIRLPSSRLPKRISLSGPNAIRSFSVAVNPNAEPYRDPKFSAFISPKSLLRFRQGEPTYGTKALGEWLKRKPGQEEFSPETKHAVQAMGTNALPALLARLMYVDGKYGLYDYDTSLESVGGFYLLGDLGRPALPKLAELINGDDERIAVFALISCCGMGSNAVPVVVSGLTNDFAGGEVRGAALPD